MKQAGRLMVPILALTMTSGCGARVGDLQGTVSIEGRPLSRGMVCLLCAGNRVIRAAVLDDSTYVARGVPIGETRAIVYAAVEPPGETVADGAASGGGQFDPTEPGSVARPTPTSRGPSIPALYQDFSTSPLLIEVRPGMQTWDLAVTSGKASVGERAQ